MEATRSGRAAVNVCYEDAGERPEESPPDCYETAELGARVGR